MTDPICPDAGCDRPIETRGYCKKHYVFRLRTGLISKLPPRPAVPCSVDGCDRPVQCNNMCKPHDSMMRKRGTTVPAVIVSDPLELWLRKVDTNGADGCWLWTGTINPYGYGVFDSRFRQRGDSWMAHRWGFERLVEPVPRELHVDHICRVRHCVNPDHLEAVTAQENIRRIPYEVRPRGPQSHRKTHCIYGHELTVSGDRQVCRPCVNANQRRYSQRKREAKGSPCSK